MKTISHTISLLLGCAALLLSACSQQEEPGALPEAADRKIVFHTSLPDLTSRAAGITTDLDYLHLTAFHPADQRLIDNGKLKEYFSNEKLEKSDGSTMFASDRCQWPEPGREDEALHFFAYHPSLPESASLTNSTTVSSGAPNFGYKMEKFSVAPDIADQIDFVTAYAAGTMNANLFSGINLNFLHQLCRVEVMAKGTHKSCNIEIAGVSIANAFMQGDFQFQSSDADDAFGTWTGTTKDTATYIFRQGDKIITVGAEPQSIMGSKLSSGDENCAMLIPASYTPWAYATDPANEAKGLYLNVLLRIIDATPTAGKGLQRYPYTDNSQGLNAPNIPIVLFAVDNKGAVTDNYGTLYKEDKKYYTDPNKTKEFTVPAGKTVREFGWAAIPVTGDWKSGRIHTYTLDYTYGVGLHGPEVTGDVSPKAGDPIISDRVGVSLGFKDWTKTNAAGVTVPGN